MAGRGVHQARCRGTRGWSGWQEGEALRQTPHPHQPHPCLRSSQEFKANLKALPTKGGREVWEWAEVSRTLHSGNPRTAKHCHLCIKWYTLTTSDELPCIWTWVNLCCQASQASNSLRFLSSDTFPFNQNWPGRWPRCQRGNCEADALAGGSDCRAISGSVSCADLNSRPLTLTRKSREIRWSANPRCEYQQIYNFGAQQSNAPISNTLHWIKLFYKTTHIEVKSKYWSNPQNHWFPYMYLPVRQKGCMYASCEAKQMILRKYCYALPCLEFLCSNPCSEGAVCEQEGRQ